MIEQMKSNKRVATNIPTQERLTEDLEMYDVNNDGKIDKTELVYYMKNTIFAKPNAKGGNHQSEKEAVTAMAGLADAPVAESAPE